MTATTSRELILGDTRLSGAQLDKRVASLAASLARVGVHPTDRVAILMRNDIAYIEAFLAIARAGASPVPINWHATRDEIVHVLDDSAAKVVVAHCDLLKSAFGLIPAMVTTVQVTPSPEVVSAFGLSTDQVPGVPTWTAWAESPDELPDLTVALNSAIPNLVTYTSGSTGRPKGVLRIRKDDTESAALSEQIMRLMGYVPGHRTAVLSPLYHAAPSGHALIMLRLGATVLIMPRFDPLELLRFIEQHRLTHLQMVPTMFVRLLELPPEQRNRYDHSSLRHIVHSAGPCPAHVKAAMIDWWGPIIHEAYGGTEVGNVSFCTSHDALTHPGTVGRALPGVTIRILGPDGIDVAPGDVGEIYVKNDAMPDFAYLNDEASRAAVERDGFVTQGDLGRLDDDGFLYLAGRTRDMIVSSGVNIYSIEIENVLATMPGVRMAAAFAVPHDVLGEAVGVGVELDGSAEVTPDDVRAWVRDRLGALKQPTVVDFVSELSTSDVGKVFKHKLAAKYWERSSTPVGPWQ